MGLNKPVWLPPRGRYPCRKVVIEILTRYWFQTHTTPKQKFFLDINIDRLAENRVWDKKYVERFYPVCDPISHSLFNKETRLNEQHIELQSIGNTSREQGLRNIA